VDTWSHDHIAALLVTAVTVVALVIGARRTDAWAARAGRVLAVLILIGYLGEHIVYALRGEWTVRVNLPLHLTDMVTLASVAALWRPDSQLLVELVYFWALSASLQAVLTPDLGHGFPDPLFFTYFVTHAGAVAAACLLVLGSGRTPRAGAVTRTFWITLAVAVAAGVATVLTGGNYMFLRRKPAHDSLLDLMGPWPLYIASGAALGLLILLALAACARHVPPRT
jgi:hypothetical integral membrane protein (TIGR02206 family)